MAGANRPTGRKKVVTGGTGNVFKRGSGLNLGGPVGNGGKAGGAGGSMGARPGMGSPLTGNPTGSGGVGGMMRGLGQGKGRIGCFGLIIIVIVIVFLLMRCGGGLLSGGSSLLGGGAAQTEAYNFDQGNSGQTSDWGQQHTQSQKPQGWQSYQQTQPAYNESVYDAYQPTAHDPLNDYYAAYGQNLSNNNGVLNTSVVDGIRDRYTKIKGGGKDTATVMVYMCGTDLESSNGAGTADLQEMLYSALNDKVNVIVYTGGCRKWKNNVISSTSNQVYRITSKGLERLVSDAGNGAMTDPKTLTSFIKWAAENYPANRNSLIFWDHGGGTVDGYGYDEKNKSAGSMTLTKINKALKDAGMKFDFIGFDACLMSTLETGLIMSQYADYMIASEETEPAYGWYYTDWLTQYANNTSIPTLELAKTITDTYYNANAKYSSYSGITLSVTDLAELQKTVPAPFAAFSDSLTGLIENDGYKEVSNARSTAKEFASSNRVDMIDLVDLADNIGSKEAAELIEAVQSAVKYNRTSNNMSKAYGLSVYFPYRCLSDLNDAVKTYESTGVTSEYSKAISAFASQQATGQLPGSNVSNPFESLFGGSFGSYGGSTGSYGSSGGYGTSGGSSSQGGMGDLSDLFGGFGYSGGNSSSGGSNYSGSMDADMMTQMLEALLGGSFRTPSGLDSSNTGFMDRAHFEDNVTYALNNSLDPTKLVWTKNAKGQKVLDLSDEDWGLIDTALLSVLVDDGEGYIDLGLDAVYEWDENNALIGEYDNTWLSVNGQPVAYYFLSETTDGDNYSIEGYIPAMVNGERANLLVTFDNEHEAGIITGMIRLYDNGETGTQKKTEELKDGDTIDFICDYYSYEGEFVNNYYLGNQLTVDGELQIANIDIGDAANASYKITDIYNQGYWTPLM